MHNLVVISESEGQTILVIDQKKIKTIIINKICSVNKHFYLSLLSRVVYTFDRRLKAVKQHPRISNIYSKFYSNIASCQTSISNTFLGLISFTHHPIPIFT